MTDTQPSPAAVPGIQNVIYIGRRICADGSLCHFYQRLDGPQKDTEIVFKKQLDGWHRIGDVLELEHVGEGRYRNGPKVIEHRDGAEHEVQDTAAAQHFQAEKLAKSQAMRSDLSDGLLPLKRAYLRIPSPQRAALIAWVARQMMGWK